MLARAAVDGGEQGSAFAVVLLLETGMSTLILAVICLVWNCHMKWNRLPATQLESAPPAIVQCMLCIPIIPEGDQSNYSTALRLALVVSPTKFASC